MDLVVLVWTVTIVLSLYALYHTRDRPPTTHPIKTHVYVPPDNTGASQKSSRKPSQKSSRKPSQKKPKHDDDEDDDEPGASRTVRGAGRRSSTREVKGSGPEGVQSWTNYQEI